MSEQPEMLGRWAVNSVNNVDLLTLCAGLPDQSVDMLLADLPYGTTGLKWDEIIPFGPMWEQFERIIKPRGAVVLFGSQPFTTKLIASNLGFFKYCLVWDKVSKGDIMNAKNKPLKQHEDICIFSHGTTANKSPRRMNYYPVGVTPNPRNKHRNPSKPESSFNAKRPSHTEYYKCQGTGYPSSILRYTNANNGLKQHPTQKPVPLFEYLIRTYTQPGELIVDPVVGSGTTGVAARNTGRRFIVGDISPEYCEIARGRLEQGYTPNMFDLFERGTLNE